MDNGGLGVTKVDKHLNFLTLVFTSRPNTDPNVILLPAMTHKPSLFIREGE